MPSSSGLLVQTGRIYDDTWLAAVEDAWQVAIADVMATAGHAPEAAYLPGYQIKRVRLRQVTARVRELLMAPEAKDAAVITEPTLEAKNGRLFGRPDLIIQVPESTESSTTRPAGCSIARQER